MMNGAVCDVSECATNHKGLHHILCECKYSPAHFKETLASFMTVNTRGGPHVKI